MVDGTTKKIRDRMVHNGISPKERRARRVEDLRGFRPDIEGLRAVAVLLVILFHAGIPLFGGGFVGVDVFFVISGFLITRLLVTELLTTGRISLPDFYLRRTRRLLPALALVTVTTLVLARLLSPDMATSTAEDGIWASFYLVNFHFLATGLDYFAGDLPDSPLLHLWSLAIEEQFYLIWPPILLLVASRVRAGSLRAVGVAIGVIGGASIMASIAYTASYPVQAYFLPMTRIWELFAGAFLAIIPLYVIPTSPRIAGVMAATGLGAIAVAGTTFSAETVFPGSAALLPVVGTMVVMACAPHAGGIHGLLSSPAMQWIGKRSYSLYLWHWPLLVLIADAGTNQQSLPFSLVAVGCSIALAALTYRAVENPVRRADFFKGSRKHGLLLVAFLTLGPVMFAGWMIFSPPELAGDGAAVASVTLGTKVNAEARLHAALKQSAATDGLPSNLTPALDRGILKEDNYSEKKVHRRATCFKLTLEGDLVTSNCVYGVVSSNTTIVLFGDSHALHWLPALEKIAERREWKIVFMGEGACPSMDIFPWTRAKMYGEKSSEECIKLRDLFVQRIALEKPSYVILSNKNIYCAKADCPAGMASMITSIREASPESKIVVFEDIPFRSSYPAKCLLKYKDAIQNCAIDRETADAQGHDEIALAVQQSGALWVNTADWFCTTTSCPATIGNVRVMIDRDHMTTEMSLLLAPLVEKSLDSAR